ncbi:hypothetical protein AWB85_14750 [Mycobacteroides immunogenum]|uniref:HTH tetR-type domain-containing protein n=1 Tax=Mycobacteroides immunogenum TaxID=83262 RepID=A0A179V7C5_9MYCO|nr:TetR/AcrR family transcriptional regulator C-terminal domain-containing protein [Mycobacteroides immunogenum]OAT66885.1 hypothetical protein AWB85_14750 [Mycobacteroides immunogenum]
MKARFTRDEIAAAALALVDTKGLAGLSMRSLASELGTGPMTLYNYVSDKEALEELVVAAVMMDAPAPQLTDDWRADVEFVAHAMWAAVRRHPAAIPLVLTRRISSAAAVAPAEALIGALSRGGLTGEVLLAAFRAVLSFVLGAQEAGLGSLSDRDAREVAAKIGEVAGEAYPHAAALAKIAQKSSAATEFENGLAMLLDGIALRATVRRSR